MKKYFPALVALFVVWAVLRVFYNPTLTTSVEPSVSYDTLLTELNSGNLSEVYLKGSTIYAKTKSGTVLMTQSVGDNWFVSDVLKRGDVKLSAVPPEKPSVLSTFFWSFGPVLLMIGVFVYLNKKASGTGGGGGPGGMFNFGKSRATIGVPEGTKITFADVAGCDEAKAEVAEIVDFLKNPGKYKKVGGRSPKGVLMVGPPGTGKTLLAKAMAGEAGVAFTSMSGSDFVEMFVGVGAARVRDLFEKAKKHAPCIIFIDEIDAVGRHRGIGTGGGNDEREQTLNQLLVEMDGFESESGVIVIAATNRVDVLDPALLRPGRFDRQVAVSLPDVRGREQILNVHLRKIPVGPSVDIHTIAKGTPRFSGAELENLVNEAALCAARENLVLVEMRHFETAKDKILMGPEKKSMKMSESEKSDTAYHEAGHAVVAHLLEHTDPVHKVSIIPRSNALGVTVQLPDQERYSMGKKRILDTIAVLFGGRVAEELFTGDITTGASNDYERATQLAKNMVTKWGMSENLGHMVVGTYGSDPFSEGGGSTGQNTASAETLKKIDEEVNNILNAQYERVRELLITYTPQMHEMRDLLMEVETLDSEDIHRILGKVESAG